MWWLVFLIMTLALILCIQKHCSLDVDDLDEQMNGDGYAVKWNDAVIQWHCNTYLYFNDQNSEFKYCVLEVIPLYLCFFNSAFGDAIFYIYHKWLQRLHHQILGTLLMSGILSIILSWNYNTNSQKLEWFYWNLVRSWSTVFQVWN